MFSGAHPYIDRNDCHTNHHFGIAARDQGARPDLARNLCRENMLSGILLFHHAEAMVIENTCCDNQQWGFMTIPECRTSPNHDELVFVNTFTQNPNGPVKVTEEPLAEIGP